MKESRMWLRESLFGRQEKEKTYKILIDKTETREEKIAISVPNTNEINISFTLLGL